MPDYDRNYFLDQHRGKTKTKGLPRSHRGNRSRQEARNAQQIHWSLKMIGIGIAIVVANVVYKLLR